MIPPLGLFPRLILIQRNTLRANISTSSALRAFSFVGMSADITDIIRVCQTTEGRNTYSASLSNVSGYVPRGPLYSRSTLSDLSTGENDPYTPFMQSFPPHTNASSAHQHDLRPPVSR